MELSKVAAAAERRIFLAVLIFADQMLWHKQANELLVDHACATACMSIAVHMSEIGKARRCLL